MLQQQVKTTVGEWEQKEQEKYKPYDRSSVRMPSASRLNLEFLRLVHSGGWTNGHILDMFSLPRVVQAKIDKVGLDNLITLDQKKVEKLFLYSKNAKTDLFPLALYDLPEKGERKSGRIVLGNPDADGMVFMVNLDYYSYFAKVHKGCRFVGSSENQDLIRVTLGERVVGFIATMLLPDNDTPADVLRRSLAAR